MNQMIPKFLVMVGSEEDPNHFCVSEVLGVDNAVEEYEDACVGRQPGEIVRLVLIEKELEVADNKKLFVELKPSVGMSIQYEVVPDGEYEDFYIARDPSMMQRVFVLPKSEYHKIVKHHVR